jgi:ferredoxin
MGMQRDWSSYVIADPCIGLKDATCIEVCPVDCIETTPQSPQYYINPELCIVCEQCVLVCPVDAIYLEHELPEEWKPAIERNAGFFLDVAEAVPLVALDEAHALVLGALARALELGIDVAAAVVDRDGNVAAVDGVDAQASRATDLAYSAGRMERSTVNLNDRLVNGAADGIDRSRLVQEAGGIPFGRPYVIAGLGVSGGTPEENHECARAALAPR